MLELTVRPVRPEHVELLRDWFAEVGGPRRPEALATLEDETVSQELAALVDCGGAHLLIYAMLVDDPERARRAAQRSTHLIDAQHRSVMQTALGEPIAVEVLLDLRKA
jgi:hypothetical protein